MKVLLIQPPHVFEGGSREPDCFPLGLGYIGKALLDAGHKVEVLNVWQHQMNNYEVLEELDKRSFDVVGITALSSQYKYVKWFASVLKEKSSAKIVLGGALATFNSSLVLDKTDVDYCVCGEGEGKIVDVLSKPLPDIKASYQGYPLKLDGLGFPAWHLFDMTFYTKPRWYYGKFVRPMNVISSRGCPWNCNFCSKVIDSPRLRSVSNIVEEIKNLQFVYGVDFIKFDDELVMVSKERMHKLCDALEPLHIHWACNGRVNIVDKEILVAMKDAGCLAIGYGVESGSQKILDAMNKQTSVAQNKTAILETLNAGIHPIVYMMFGYPSESHETLDETVAFFKDIPFVGERIYMATTTALPGSRLYTDEVIPELEEEYLEKLTGGYLRFGGKRLLNFTHFPASQFDALREETENRIFRTQVWNHPFTFLKVMVKRVWNKLRRKLK